MWALQLLLSAAQVARGEPAGVAAVPAEPGQPPAADAAQTRYNEMLSRMRAAVEEVAQLYGNPTFLEVFTNDPERAADLRRRLRTDRTAEQVRAEAGELLKKRDDLLGDIALKKRESSRMAERLARQRAALDAVALAVEQARKAVEDTTR